MSFEQSSDKVVHISNLPSGITTDFIKILLQECGEVVNVTLKERQNGNFAFVTFDTPESALKAIKEFNYTKLNGSPIVITPTTQEYQNLIKSGEGNLYVRGLDVYIEVSQLHELFQTYGEVISCKLPTGTDGLNKGYAYVQFRDPNDAEKARVELNDAVINGKKISVEPYKKKERPQKTSPASNPRGAPASDDVFTNIFIRNLPSNVRNETDLGNLFSEFGVVISTKMLPDGFSGFCNMIDHDSAVRAIQALNGKVIDGKVLEVVRAISKEERMGVPRPVPGKSSYLAPNSFTGYSSNSQSAFSSQPTTTPTPAPNPTNSSFGSSSTTTFGGSSSMYGNSSKFSSSASSAYTAPSAPSPFGSSSYSAYGNNSTSVFATSTTPSYTGSAFGMNTRAPKNTYGSSSYVSNPQSAYGTPGGSSSYVPPQNTAYGVPSAPYGASAYGVPKQTTPYGNSSAFGDSPYGIPKPYGANPMFGSPYAPQQTYTAFGSSSAYGQPSPSQPAGQGSPNQSRFGQPSYGQSAFGAPAKAQVFSAPGQNQ